MNVKYFLLNFVKNMLLCKENVYVAKIWRAYNP